MPLEINGGEMKLPPPETWQIDVKSGEASTIVEVD
jgi:hypothetical protein